MRRVLLALLYAFLAAACCRCGGAPLPVVPVTDPPRPAPVDPGPVVTEGRGVIALEKWDFVVEGMPSSEAEAALGDPLSTTEADPFRILRYVIREDGQPAALWMQDGKVVHKVRPR